VANQKRLTQRFSLGAPTAEGMSWDDARHEIQLWMENVVSILDSLATSGDLDDHNDLNGLQGGSLTERYHFTQAQHAYLANHDTAPDPHPQYVINALNHPRVMIRVSLGF
jgi:hypothetical protein